MEGVLCLSLLANDSFWNVWNVSSCAFVSLAEIKNGKCFLIVGTKGTKVLNTHAFLVNNKKDFVEAAHQLPDEERCCCSSDGVSLPHYSSVTQLRLGRQI